MSYQGVVDGGEVQLMADGCVALLQLVFGETNWSRWNQIKQHTELTDFQTFLTWLLDLAEQDITNSLSSYQGYQTPAEDVTPQFSQKPEIIDADDIIILPTSSSSSSSLPTRLPPVREHIPSMNVMRGSDEVDVSGSGIADGAAEVLRVAETDNFFCQVCQVSLSDLIVVREHERLRHDGVGIFISCSCCSHRFRSVRDYVNYHKALVAVGGGGGGSAGGTGGGGGGGGKTYVCDECAKAFNARQELEDHINNKHLRLGPLHQCQFCGKKFSHGCNLSRHRKRCTMTPHQPEGGGTQHQTVSSH